MPNCPKCQGPLVVITNNLNVKSSMDGREVYLWYPMIDVATCSECGFVPFLPETVTLLEETAQGLAKPGTMLQYAIFDHPVDYADKWVISIKTIAPLVVMSDPKNVIFADTLEEARQKCPKGAFKVERTADDVQFYVESWMISAQELAEQKIDEEPK